MLYNFSVQENYLYCSVSKSGSRFSLLACVFYEYLKTVCILSPSAQPHKALLLFLFRTLENCWTGACEGASACVCVREVVRAWGMGVVLDFIGSPLGYRSIWQQWKSERAFEVVIGSGGDANVKTWWQIELVGFGEGVMGSEGRGVMKLLWDHALLCWLELTAEKSNGSVMNHPPFCKTFLKYITNQRQRRNPIFTLSP